MKMNDSEFMRCAGCLFTMIMLSILLCACKKESNENKNENVNATKSQIQENCSYQNTIAVEVQGKIFSVPRKSGIKIITEAKEELWDIDKQEVKLPCNNNVVKNAWGIVFSATSLNKKFHAHILKPGYLLSTTSEKYYQDVEKYGSFISGPQEISQDIFKY